MREAFAECKLLNGEQFDAVAWEAVYNGLHLVPRMYQLWAYKQVWNMAGTNYSHAEWDETVKKWCPSCWRAKETTAHVSWCGEAGKVKTLQFTVVFLDEWIVKRQH